MPNNIINYKTDRIIKFKFYSGIIIVQKKDKSNYFFTKNIDNIFDIKIANKTKL